MRDFTLASVWSLVYFSCMRIPPPSWWKTFSRCVTWHGSNHQEGVGTQTSRSWQKCSTTAGYNWGNCYNWESALVYNGSQNGNALDHLRQKKSAKKQFPAPPVSASDIASNTWHHSLRVCHQVQMWRGFNLPLTDSNTWHHSLRVCHEVQMWRGFSLPLTDWGWKVSGKSHSVWQTEI